MTINITDVSIDNKLLFCMKIQFLAKYHYDEEANDNYDIED